MFRVGNRILSEQSIAQMLACPKFERGSEWYGLGLDVEDKGHTWGHTGYMDGTTTTFKRHKDGFSWVLLFNAGATDQDLDGLVRFALSSSLPCVNSIGLKNNLENFEGFEILSKDCAQIYHIMIPLRDVEAIASSLKSQGYYMHDIDIVAYENEYFVNMIWNSNVAKFDWFYKIYHDTTTDVTDSEKDIVCYLNNGFLIHVLSTCTDSKHQSDIYTAIIYLKQQNRQSIHHVNFLHKISEESHLDVQSDGHVLMCSTCYYCEEVYVSVVYEESTFDINSPDVSLNSSSEQRSIPSFLQIDTGNQNFKGLGSKPWVSACKFKRIIKSRLYPSPTEVNVQSDSGSMVEKPSNIIKRNLTEDEFLDELRGQAFEHFGLIFVQFYKVPNRKDILINAIWSKFKVFECYQRLGASRYSFMNELLESSGEVTPLEAIRAYVEDGVLLFAGIWTAGKFKSKRSKRSRASNSGKGVTKRVRKS